ncbi:transposase [Parafrankia sp. Ea1.12]|uniref:winged helix-turn-helix domain-containing protein n=1 Tax=Parafrankia sp. Ea1.12 TaxID=573499 RepID=UPI000DA48852|nr:transposase [Parafrankia sp. Ea1.12]
MRYATGGGLTPAGQVERERVRLAAADRFAAGATRTEVAREFKVTPKTAGCWYRAWESGGAAALRSAGPLSRCRLDDRDLGRLEAILRRGPGVYGWEDQRWTLARVAEVIRREFGVEYTLPGVWMLLDRHGWSCQLPARRAVERDDTAVRGWSEQGWPVVKPLRRSGMPGSVSSTRQGRDCGRHEDGRGRAAE